MTIMFFKETIFGEEKYNTMVNSIENVLDYNIGEEENYLINAIKFYNKENFPNSIRTCFLNLDEYSINGDLDIENLFNFKMEKVFEASKSNLREIENCFQIINYHLTEKDMFGETPYIDYNKEIEAKTVLDKLLTLSSQEKFDLNNINSITVTYEGTFSIEEKDIKNMALYFKINFKDSFSLLGGDNVMLYIDSIFTEEKEIKKISDCVKNTQSLNFKD